VIFFNTNIQYLTENDKFQYTYEEKTKDFDKEVYNIKNNTQLIGFYQNPKYFNEFWPELSKQLTFGNKWIYESVRRFSELGANPNKCIGIHRRLGDYLKNPSINQFHPVLSLDYYEEAIYSAIRLYAKNDYQLLVFSDSLEIVREECGANCIIVDNTQYLDYCNVMDFVMLSSCSAGKILANSSYSYWAAKLGTGQYFIMKFIIIMVLIIQ
jgi:hypothetical protein